MGGKTIYNLKNQRLIYGQDNFPKTFCCVLLVMLVICALIGLTAFIVKNSQSNEKNDQEYLDPINYHDEGVGNNDMLSANKRLDSYKEIRKDFILTTVEGRNKALGSSTVAEFTSTSIESPLSTSTMSPSDISPRFLFVNTINPSNSDFNTRSTGKYVLFTGSSDQHEKNDISKRSTIRDYFDENSKDDYIEKMLFQRINIMDDERITMTNDDTQMLNTNTSPRTRYTKSQTEPVLKHSDDQTCYSNSCKQSTSRMLALMNYTAKPCEDFYSYTCGGFDLNHFEEFTVHDEILEVMQDISTFDLTVSYNKVYHDFFVSCTNYQNGRGLKEVSRVLYDLCQNNKEDLTDLIADILMTHPQKSKRKLLPLFDVIMEVGPKKTLVPTLTIPTLDSLLSDNNEQDIYERACLRSVKMNTEHKNNKSFIQQSYKECLKNETEYFKNLEKSIFLLQIFEHLPDFKKSQMIKKTLEFIEWTIIDVIGFTSEEEMINENYATVTLNWLLTSYPQIDWRKLFIKLFEEETAKQITEVRLKNSKYFTKILEFYRVNSFVDIKTSLLSMMAHDMYIDFIAPLPTDDRFKYCQKISINLMPDIASKLYLEQFNSTDIAFTEKNLMLMFEQLINKFKDSIMENRWINENERSDVLKKISQLSLISNPYTAFFNFERTYHKFYSHVYISTNDFITNVFALKSLARKRMYSTYGKSAESQDIIWNFLVWPTLTSPTRIAETNAIVLPTSLVAKFNKKMQKIEEFSTIGFLMAQEITHFFDKEKISKYFLNKNDNFNEIDVEIHLPDPAYSKHPNIFGIKLTGKEISASKYSRSIDNVALRVTFDTYNQFASRFDILFPWTEDSSAKLFYQLLSQQFCNAKKSVIEMAVELIQNEDLPYYFRVNSMMMNSETFLNTFECLYGL